MGGVVLGQITGAIAWMLNSLLWTYWWIVLGSVIVSWVNADPYNPIVRAIISVTEPVLYRIRRSLPVFGGGMDFSPIIVWAAILFLQTFLVRSLADLAVRLQ